MKKIKSLLNKSEKKNNFLVLYRLDQENELIDDKRNLTGMAIGAHKDHVDKLSLEFYKYLERSDICGDLRIGEYKLYGLYTRQVKLKLASLIKCALRIKHLTDNGKKRVVIITDRQTVSIMKKVFIFLNFETSHVEWRLNATLTTCIGTNSLLMRFAAILRMFLFSATLGKHYYFKHIDSSAATILITMPKRRPEDFFQTYVHELSNDFNLILYSLGNMNEAPKGFERRNIKRSFHLLRGIFNAHNGPENYIADILLVYRDHANLGLSLDVSEALFTNNIDVYINRHQTIALENLLVDKAKKEGVYILGDVFEEIFYCDSAICPSKSEETEVLKLALADNAKITIKGTNSLINYRLQNYDKQHSDYLRTLLKIDNTNKLIFYASDPSKEESQRFLTEKFLIDFFSKYKQFSLVIKTHPQDKGKITDYAFINSASPSNVTLIGDIAQKENIASKRFRLFENFDFNAAIASSDGFLTFSSSSILQALSLEIKTGIVDKFDNGFYDYLINNHATMLIKNEQSLLEFLNKKKLDVSDEVLAYCGLKSNQKKFDLGMHLMECLHKHQKIKESSSKSSDKFY